MLSPSFLLLTGLFSLSFSFLAHAQNATSQATTVLDPTIGSLTAGVLIPAHVYPPLTVTGQFPCLTANSYMIFTDSDKSSLTYPIWTCTSSDCGGSSSTGRGLMVFPATVTTGEYEVQNPPSGYPALRISASSIITDTSFSTQTFIDVGGPQPTTTNTLTYAAFPGLSLTIATTTPITAVLATPVSVPLECAVVAGAPNLASQSSISASASGASTSIPSSATQSSIPTSASGATSISISATQSSILASTLGATSVSNSASQSSTPTSVSGTTSILASTIQSSTQASASDTTSIPISTSQSSTQTSASDTTSIPISTSQSFTPSSASGATSTYPSAASSATIIPQGAIVITSTLVPSGSVTTSRVISQTFTPTTYSTLTGLTSTLTTSTVVYLGTNSTTAVAATIYPGGVAWGIPTVGPGTPILSAPTVAPNIGSPRNSTLTTQTVSSSISVSSIFSTSSSLRLSSASSTSPTSLTSAPSAYNDLSPSSISTKLTTFSGTTSPTVDFISTGISSNTHSPTGLAIALPIFWGLSEFCLLFCPLAGRCPTCGWRIYLPPGIYPPGSITFPPDWKQPDTPITIEEDGTPAEDEDDGPSSAPARTAVSTPMATTTSQSSSSAVSSSTASSRSLCGSSCPACTNIYSPPSLKIKRDVEDDEVTLKKRVFGQPSNNPWNGNMARFITDQARWNFRGFVPHGDPETHPSSSQFKPLGNVPFTTGVDGLYGCTSLIVHSTRGVWISHFFEDPSFYSLALRNAVRDPNARRVQQKALFKSQIIDLLGPGDDSGLFVGLNTYIGADDATGKPFSEDASVEAVIITPENENGDRVYEDMAEQIATEVTRLFGGDRSEEDPGRLVSDIEFINYVPQEPSLGFTTNGLALFQYEPVQSRCQDQNTGQVAQLAERRLWFESENPGPLVLEYWPAWPEQQVASQQPGSKRSRGLAAANNETEHDERDHRRGSGRRFRRRRDWTPGVQDPPVYPACLIALESAASGPVPTAAVEIGPDGPLSAPPTLSVAPSSSIIIATTTPTPTPSSSSSSSWSLFCRDEQYFDSRAGCEAECVGGFCVRPSWADDFKKQKRCPGCGDWGPSLEEWVCRCFWRL